MTDLAEVARQVRARYRQEQGLPEVVEDPAVLDQLADLLDTPRREASCIAPPGVGR